MATFVFGTGLREEPMGPLPAASPAAMDDGGIFEDGLSLDELHRRIMLRFRDGDMASPDAPVKMGVTIPRRLHAQFTMLAQHRGQALGRLTAEILTQYMRQYYRRLQAGAPADVA